MNHIMNRLRLSDFEKIATGWPKFGLYGMKFSVFKKKSAYKSQNRFVTSVNNCAEDGSLKLYV